MVTKDFKIKQKTSTGFDVLYPETRAEQVIINQTTGATLATHLADFVLVSRFGASKNSTTIQSALNYAKSIGGAKVLVPSGVYDITETLLIPSNTSLIAEGIVNFKRKAEISAVLLNDADGITGGYEANKNMTVEGIIFDANNAEFTGNVTSLSFGHSFNVVIENCDFIGCLTWHDLELNGVKNAIVRNCRFNNYKGSTESLQLDYMGSTSQFPWFGPMDNTTCTDVYVEHCEFTHTKATRGATAIGNHTFLAGAVTKNFTIRNNKFVNFLTTINFNDVNGLFIVDNEFSDCMTGVVFTEKQNDSRNWVIKDNTFRNVKPFDEGAQVDGRFFNGTSFPLTKNFYDIRIIDNVIEKTSGHGIGFTASGNVFISGNTITQCNRNGIYIFGATYVNISENLVLLNNKLSESGRADIVVGNSPVQTRDVIVSNNTVNNMSFGTAVTDAIVTNNIIKDSITTITGTTKVNNLIKGVWTP